VARRSDDNPVREVVARDEIGGVSGAARLCRVRERTIERWRKEGTIGDAAAVLRLAKALGGSAAAQLVLACRLAGLADEEKK